jgi:hypothetical protein
LDDPKTKQSKEIQTNSNIEEMSNMYSRGKIYKLTSNDLTYYGSTTQPLNVRIGGHKQHYNYYKNGKRDYITSFKLFENEGVPEITLVEDFPCERKEQLHARERHFIENNECINKFIPTRTKKEWRNENKEDISTKSKIYKENNKEHIKQKNKEYSELNKEKIKEYEKKRNQIETVCKCGLVIKGRNIQQHELSKKHLKFIE